MNKKTIIKYCVIILMLFFILINFTTLLDELLSGYLLNPSEWKSFIFVSIDFILGIISLIGVWKMKKWAYAPLIALTAFGLILSIIYPPTNISGGIFDKISNLPFDLFVGILALVLFTIAWRIVSPVKKNGPSQNNNG